MDIMYSVFGSQYKWFCYYLFINAEFSIKLSEIELYSIFHDVIQN